MIDALIRRSSDSGGKVMGIQKNKTKTKKKRKNDEGLTLASQTEDVQIPSRSGSVMLLRTSEGWTDHSTWIGATSAPVRPSTLRSKQTFKLILSREFENDVFSTTEK
jgi:hypothetical protein